MAYVVEFLAAVMVTLYAWGEIGGQGHMDLIPWYWKLVLPVGFSLGTVLATHSMVESDTAWNPRSFRWFLLVAVLAVAMGSLTYYYHSQEPVEDQDTIEESTASGVKPGNRHAEG